MSIRTDDAERIAVAFEELAATIANTFHSAVSRAEQAEAAIAARAAEDAARDAQEARINAAIDRLQQIYVQIVGMIAPVPPAA